MKEIATVYETENLEIFKTLAGNRDVKEKRKAKLIESIDKYGYITNPIIVNEKYEVIDGQGRLAACKELGVPISYIIVPNIGIKECQVFNMYGGTPVSERIIKEGRAVSSEETYQNAKEALEYLVTVKPFTDKVDGRKTDLESAVLFAYYDENCDNGRLSEALSKYYNTIGNIISITSALDELSKVYNRQLQKKARLYLREDYDRFRY